MVLLGMKVGERMVNVRVDDLNEARQAEVRDAMKLIEGVWSRDETPSFAGLLGGLGAFVLVFVWAMVSRVPDSQGATTLGAAVCVAFPVGLSAWLVARSVCRKRNARDVAVLNQFLVSSTRCHELMDAYLDANPSFKKLLGNPQLVPGQV